MGFDVSNLTKPVACEFLPPGCPKGQGLKLELNLNLISIEFMEKLESELNETVVRAKKISEIEEKVLKGDESAFKAEESPQISFFFQQKEEIRFKARILGGEAGKRNDPNRIIVSWDLERKGKPVPVCQEEIIKLGKPMVDALFQFCMLEAGQPTKKNE
jgi:hypothetical protein